MVFEMTLKKLVSIHRIYFDPYLKTWHVYSQYLYLKDNDNTIFSLHLF